MEFNLYILNMLDYKISQKFLNKMPEAYVFNMTCKGFQRILRPK